jgi:hypothetical protein
MIAFLQIQNPQHREREREREREGNGGKCIRLSERIDKDRLYTESGAAGFRMAGFVWADRKLPMVLLLPALYWETHRISKTKTNVPPKMPIKIFGYMSSPR